MTSDLEAYRREVLESVAASGEFYRDEAARMLGVPVVAVYIHGSVMSAKRFHEKSDVDIAVVVDVPDRPDGPCDDYSASLAGALSDGVSGVVDVGVLNRARPQRPYRRIA